MNGSKLLPEEIAIIARVRKEYEKGVHTSQFALYCALCEATGTPQRSKCAFYNHIKKREDEFAGHAPLNREELSVALDLWEKRPSRIYANGRKMHDVNWAWKQFNEYMLANGKTAIGKVQFTSEVNKELYQIKLGSLSSTKKKGAGKCPCCSSIAVHKLLSRGVLFCTHCRHTQELEQKKQTA